MFNDGDEQKVLQLHIYHWTERLSKCLNRYYYEGDIEKNKEKYQELLSKIEKAEKRIKKIQNMKY